MLLPFAQCADDTLQIKPSPSWPKSRTPTGSCTEPDLPLFDLGLLDSLGIVTLITRFAEEFDVDISPAEFERETWATPAKSSRTWNAASARS